MALSLCASVPYCTSFPPLRCCEDKCIKECEELKYCDNGGQIGMTDRSELQEVLRDVYQMLNFLPGRKTPPAWWCSNHGLRLAKGSTSLCWPFLSGGAWVWALCAKRGWDSLSERVREDELQLLMDTNQQKMSPQKYAGYQNNYREDGNSNTEE